MDFIANLKTPFIYEILKFTHLYIIEIIIIIITGTYLNTNEMFELYS